MSPYRPTPHRPMPGSVRPQDAPRLQRLRARLARRWQRRHRRQRWFLVLAIVALAIAVSLSVAFAVRPAKDATLRSLELAAVTTLLLGAIAGAVYSLWRFDRARRKARSAHIRLHHVERRLAALTGIDDGGAEERPVA